MYTNYYVSIRNLIMPCGPWKMINRFIPMIFIKNVFKHVIQGSG